MRTTITNQLFEAALGSKGPGYLHGVGRLDTGKRQTVIAVEVVEGSGSAYTGLVGPRFMHGVQIGGSTILISSSPLAPLSAFPLGLSSPANRSIPDSFG
jgi:hypothetical protein